MEQVKYIALLRGINLGGNHKLPMADLKTEVRRLGFANPDTLLNSGNLVFEAPVTDPALLEEQLSQQLQATFGFPVPVLARTGEELMDLIKNNPFRDVTVTPDTRLYCSFLAAVPQETPEMPWTSPDGAYRILEIRGRTICSVLDVGISGSTKFMDAMEKLFGRNSTTRNYNTVQRMVDKWLSNDAG